VWRLACNDGSALWRRALYWALLGIGLTPFGFLWDLPAALSSVGTQVTLTTMEVDIRPEHDDPRVLVIYRGTLSAQAQLPYPLTFSIPAGAQVHAAAYRRDGQLFAAQYQTERDGERRRVTFLTPVPDFQFEYYADLLFGRPQKTFTVEVAFPLPVEALEISVEQPLRSTGFTLSPAPARTATGGGFTYYLYAEGRWPAGKVWSVRGTYRKEDDEPSLPRTAALPGPASPGALQPGVAPPAGPGPLIWLLPALLGIIAGVAGTVAVAFLRGAWTGRSADTRGRDRDRTGRRRPQPPERYCAHCGTPADPGDRFCTRCGHPLIG